MHRLDAARARRPRRSGSCARRSARAWPGRWSGPSRRSRSASTSGVVLAAEWPHHYPIETIKAGAVAVKQYAWYYTIVYRGGEVELEDGSTACYDVEDTTVDQVYYPENPDYRRTDKLLSADRVVLAGDAAQVPTGDRLEHVLPDGLPCRRRRRVRRRRERLEALPEQHPSLRDGRAEDARHPAPLPGAAPRDRDARAPRHRRQRARRCLGVRRERTGRARRAPLDAGSRATEPGIADRQALAIGGLVGALSSDVDGDGRDDLVWMRRTGPEAEARIRVARSSGVDYGDSTRLVRRHDEGVPRRRVPPLRRLQWRRAAGRGDPRAR